MGRVLVAMSGGVDSSVAAALLLDAGQEVEGATMLLHGGAGERTAVQDAESVCAVLGIPHRVLDLRVPFARCVMEPFLSEYLRGRTPNPCMYCNREIKFGAFYTAAREAGFERIATGHYARIEGGLVRRPERAKKEQTYVFALVEREVLSHLLLPCGAYPKEEIRAAAKRYRLPVAEKADSQEICFIEDNDYTGWIERRCGVLPEGEFLDENGAVLGRHRGIIHYTVGQRKGLGLALPEPRFVGRIDAAANQVVLVPSERLYGREMVLSALNLHLPLEDGERILAQPRYNARPAPARFFRTERGARIVFDEAQRALTPGQVAALYRGDTLAGGGVIDAAV